MRTVQCVSHDASGPRVVEDAVCAAFIEAPPSLRSCNVHRCAEYRVTGWSAVSKHRAAEVIPNEYIKKWLFKHKLEKYFGQLNLYFGIISKSH